MKKIIIFISIILAAIITTIVILNIPKVEYIFMASHLKPYYLYDINDSTGQHPIFIKYEGKDELDGIYFDIDLVDKEQQSCFLQVGVCDVHITYKGAGLDATFLVYETLIDRDLLDLYYEMITDGVYLSTYDVFYQSLLKENLEITEVLIHSEQRAVIIYSDSSMVDLGNLYEYSG